MICHWCGDTPRPTRWQLYDGIPTCNRCIGRRRRQEMELWPTLAWVVAVLLVAAVLAWGFAGG